MHKNVEMLAPHTSATAHGKKIHKLYTRNSFLHISVGAAQEARMFIEYVFGSVRTVWEQTLFPPLRYKL